MRKIVLASSSPYRRALLTRLGLPFDEIAPTCDEAAIMAAPLPPDQIVTRLARLKAETVAARAPDAIVIGSDQVAELQGEILGKPGSPARARAQLARLQGRSHRLLTGLAVLDATSGRCLEALDTHELRMRPLDAAQIAHYVERDHPVDCAGAYKIEQLGIALFERIVGDDFTAIVGLPLTRVSALLERLGVHVL